ncbi:MAG: DNA-binding protein [Proteobacteria bacterium]|nr:DNA-binding protein [Pseudomonadota bacterium]
MAKTSGVTYEQVALACQSLLKEGQSPTFRPVLARTGGAAAKVSEYLNRWRNEQENIVLAALDEELSPQVKQAILAESARKTTLVKQQLSVKLTAIEQQLAEMGELLLKTDLEKDRLILELQKVQQQIIEQDKRQAVADQRLLDAQARCQELERLYRESALAHERVNTEKSMIQKQNEALEKRIDDLKNNQPTQPSNSLSPLKRGMKKVSQKT